MARTLVIGGTLFIGRALVEQLLERGDEVVIMHRGAGTPFGTRVSEIRCDRNDVAAVRAALMDRRFDVVYDNVYDWQRGTTADQVSAAAAAASTGLRRYVFTSSMAVYPSGGPHDEGDPLVTAGHPNAYGVHKADSERALFEMHRRDGLPVATLRPAFIYGPHNPFDREAFFWDRIRADRPIIIPEDGSRRLEWVHVRDVARAAVRAATEDAAIGHAYNLADGAPISEIDYVRLLASIAGKPAHVVPVPRETIERMGGKLLEPPLYFGVFLDIPPILVRNDRLRNELGVDSIPLEDGLRETFQWYEQQQRPPADFTWEDRVLAAAG